MSISKKRFIVFLLFLYPIIINAFENKPLLQSWMDAKREYQYSDLVSTQNNKAQVPPLSTYTTPIDDTILEILIVGNNTIPSTDIQSHLITSTGEAYSAYKVTRSLKQIKSTGQFSKVTHSFEKGVLRIKVKENPIIDQINIEGSTAYSEAELIDLLQSKVHTVNNLNAVRDDIQLIASKYKTDGYMESRVTQVINPTESDHTLTFIIKEGIVDTFTVTGNTKTKDYVIIREINLEAGKPLNENELKESLRRIFNLNYFTDVRPEIVEGDTPDSKKVIFNVTEKETSGSFSFGGGYNPRSGFSLFSDLNWNNVAGTGKTIMLKSSFGVGSASKSNVSNSTYQFKYVDPWAFGPRRSFTFRTWSTSGSFVSNPLYSSTTTSQYSVWNQQRRGFDMTFGIPHTYNFRTSHKVKYESVYLPEDQNTDGTTLDALQYYIYSYTYGLSFDSRDYFMNPTKGYYNTLYIEQGLKFRTTAINFTKIDLGFRSFRPLNKKANQVFGFRTELGALLSPNINNDSTDTERQFNSQKYYIGGANTVRGYSDNAPFASGYKRAMMSVEYRYIFSQTFQVIGFVDAGNAVDTFSEIADFKNYRIGKGVGVRIMVPGLGPIRLDLGFGDNQDANSGQFVHFSIGQAF